MAEESKPSQVAVTGAINLLQAFRGPDLTRTIGQIEKSLKGVASDSYAEVLTTSGAKAEILGAAGLVKQLAAQIDVVVHALGILLCLPHILRHGEVIEYVSLGAGNTGRAFDLETNLRVAEFKFIRWQGGPESIRQNSLFKDFYEMAEHETTKEKYPAKQVQQQIWGSLPHGARLLSAQERARRNSRRFTVCTGTGCGGCRGGGGGVRAYATWGVLQDYGIEARPDVSK
jgi:hypothetical protein